MDGPVGITQCAIPPGSDFTYRFHIGEEESGTFWSVAVNLRTLTFTKFSWRTYSPQCRYHAHSETQRGDGLYGGLVIHDPRSGTTARRGVDQEILLLAGDWYHLSATRILETFMDAASNGDEVITNR